MQEARENALARKIITCTACKARFDVARYPPGSRVRCGRCSQVLTVPLDDAVAEAARKMAKPASGRTGAKMKTSADVAPRSAADMAPSPRVGIRGPETQRVVTAAGGPRAPDRDPLLGQMVNDQYRIVRKLGEGGYGAVYEAHDEQLERRMAIKVMLRSRAQSREYVTKFLREARTAAQLSHPNVVGVHGVGFDKRHGIHFLAMEFVEGRTIHDILQERGPMAADLAIDYIVQSCRGLAAAHDRNIIHRDIKPGNLMVTPAGIVKIADFGLAKVYDPEGAQSTVIGTPYFMPPEQFEGKAKDGRTDIYALGVTFYYMLTLHRPHTGNGPAQILLSVMTKEPKSVLEHRPDLPEGLWPVVYRMMHRDLAQRYASCHEIVRDLEALRGGGEEDAEPVYCPGCGVPNPMEAEACGKCGASLLETCPSCGAEDLAGTRFCGDCGANIPEERAVAALVDEARGMVRDGRLDEAETRVGQALARSPENMAVARVKGELDARREEWRARRDAVRELLGAGRATEARGTLDELRDEFSELAELDQLEVDVRSALAAQDPAAAADAEAQEKARKLEEEGRIREALVAWRGVLVLSPDDDEALDAEARLATRVEKAEALFAAATEELAAGDPESAVERLLEANTVLPDDPLIEGRLDEARRAAAELGAELDALEGEAGSSAATARLVALQGRYPGSAAVREALAKAESAGRRASADAVRERLARVTEQARAAQQAQKPRDALAAWREAFGLDPENAEATEGLARAERELAEFDALVSQSRTLLQSGDPAGALRRAEEALAVVHADPAAEAQAARARTSLETLRHEAERIRSALHEQPDDDVLLWAQELASRFSGSSLASEVLAETEAACKAAAEREVGERLKKLLARSVKLEQEGNVRAALKTYSEAVELDPADEDALAGRNRTAVRIETAEKQAAAAASLLTNGHPEAAQDAAKDSLDLLPDQREAAAALAAARAAVAEIERAQRAFGEGLETEEAEQQLRRARQLAGRFPGSPRCADLVMRAEGVVEDARARATEAALVAKLDEAQAHADAGRLAPALVAVAELLAVHADHREGRALAAAVRARRATGSDRTREGRAAATSGRHEDAIRAFEAALQADPAATGAQEGLDASRDALRRAREELQAVVDAAEQAQREAGPRAALVAWAAVLAVDASHAKALAQTERLRTQIARAEERAESGRAALAAGDPDGALSHLRQAAGALRGDPGLAESLAHAEAAAAELREALAAIETELGGADGDLEPVAARARALATRFPGAAAAGRLAESTRRAADERRRVHAIGSVRTLLRERRFGEAADLAAKLRAEGVDTPELAAAEKEARSAAGQLGGLRERLAGARAAGRLEDARDACREILHSLPDDAEARNALHEIEEVLREASARRDQAETARRRGDVEEALALYRELLELLSGAPHVQEIVTRLEGESAERRTALDAIDAALQTGDLRAGRSASRTLLERYPDDDDARDLDAAAVGLSRAVEALVRRGRRRHAAGDVERARADLDLALRIAPGDASAREARDAIG